MMKIQARDVAHYFLQRDANDSHSDGISHLKMQKLVYYAYGFHYAIFEHKLFDEGLEARQHGPVVMSLLEIYQGCGRNPITFKKENVHTTIFSTEQKLFLDSIYQEYSQYSAWKLSAMTHEETPWLNGLARGMIADEDVLEYFSQLVESNENAALLEACPDIFERIAEVEHDDFEGIPFEKVVQDLGLTI